LCDVKKFYDVYYETYNFYPLSKLYCISSVFAHPYAVCVFFTTAGQPAQFTTDYPLALKLVIPAQAGIQQIETSPRSGSTSWFCPLRGLFLLDPRLREDDE
jgi:hypothetical protein